jgi:hypothetical protein
MKRIAYVTDHHLDEAFPEQHGVDGWRNWKRVLEDISTQGITGIVIGGDIGEATARFFQSLAGYSWQLTPGNHDDYRQLKKYLPTQDGDRNNHFHIEEDASFRYLYLDTSSGALPEDQRYRLEEALDTEKQVIVFLHHPVLPVNTMVDKLYAQQNRETVKECLQQSKKPVTLFCGHYHMPDDQTAGKIRQFITPACSFQITPSAEEIIIDSSTFGYRIISFANGALETSLRLFEKESPRTN